MGHPSVTVGANHRARGSTVAIFAFNQYLRYRKEDGKLDIQREFATVPKTITIKDLKNTGEVSALCCDTNEPVSIIRNGYGVLMIISIAGYEKRHAELWKDGD